MKLRLKRRRLIERMPRKLRVTVWGENVHERKNAIVRSIYPEGMHTTIAEGINEKREFEVRTATLEQPQHGLTKQALDDTDVLVRHRNRERLAVHLGVRDFEVAVDPTRDRMTGVANPESLLLARFAPRQRTRRPH